MEWNSVHVSDGVQLHSLEQVSRHVERAQHVQLCVRPIERSALSAIHRLQDRMRVYLPCRLVHRCRQRDADSINNQRRFSQLENA